MLSLSVTKEIIRLRRPRNLVEFNLAAHRMAAVFDIELHDADTVNRDESDDDVIEIGEVILHLHTSTPDFLIVIFFSRTITLSYTFFFSRRKSTMRIQT